MKELPHIVRKASIAACLLFRTTTFAQIGQPVLQSPPNGSTDQPTDVVLQWSSGGADISYRVQVSTDNSFGTLVFETVTLSTSQPAGPLERNTLYFWRVRGESLLITGPWSDVWNFTTIPLAPGSPVLSSPSNDTTNQPTTLTLTWGASAGATKYHLQLATNLSFSPVEFQDSTLASTSQGVGPLLDNVTYHWRVRAGNSGGWSSYSTVWNFTTRSNLAPIAITDPATDITATSATLNATINPNGLSTTVKFNYGTTPGYGNAVTALESPVSGSASVRATNVLRGLLPNTTYHFAVAAFNDAGTSVGEDRSFTTNYAVEAPVLLAPSDGATDQPRTLTFLWNQSLGATTYRLQVSTSASFTTTVVDDSTLADTSRQVTSLAPQTTYCWRVRARNSIGSSPWSSVWSFTTVPPPPAPPLLYLPGNGTIDRPLTLSLHWRRSVEAASYRLQLATNAAFSVITVDQAGITDSVYAVSGLSNNTTYYWHVNASNLGGTSDWSTTWSFTTSVPPPSTPTLVSPSQGAMNQPVPLTLQWNEALYASTYHVHVSPNSDFSTLTINDSSASAPVLEVTLQYATIYFWRVRAINPAGTSAWSSARQFTTAGSPGTQSIVLPPRWSMISSYIGPSNPTLEILCDRIRSHLVLMKDGNGSVYWPSLGHNSIGEWNPAHGYQIYMQSEDTLTVTGTEIIPEFTPVPLSERWNIVAYSRTNDLSVPAAVSSISSALVIVKDNSGKVYWPAYDINTIGSMRPGEGYQMYVSQAAQLVYPSNAGSSSSSSATAITGKSGYEESAPHFRPMSYTGNNATVGIPLSANPRVNGSPLVAGDELAVFTSPGLCVGAVVWSEANTAVTVWGDNDQTPETDGILPGERMQYRVWKQSSNEEFHNVSVTYSEGDGLYSPNGIYVLSSLSASSTTGVGPSGGVPGEFFVKQNYPNPFNPSTVIAYGLPRPARIRLEVYNVIGQRVAILVDQEQPPGHRAVRFDGSNLPGGVYVYRFKADEYVMIRKMILLR